MIGACLTRIFWIGRAGATWRDLPAEVGSAAERTQLICRPDGEGDEGL
jgi:transposase